MSISTHALTEGDKQVQQYDRRKYISTHALTEGDSRAGTSVASAGYFNSRPHGGRQGYAGKNQKSGIFQLTPSRRATANLDKFFF